MKVCNDMREMSCLPKTDPGDIWNRNLLQCRRDNTSCRHFCGCIVQNSIATFFLLVPPFFEDRPSSLLIKISSKLLTDVSIKCMERDNFPGSLLFSIPSYSTFRSWESLSKLGRLFGLGSHDSLMSSWTLKDIDLSIRGRLFFTATTSLYAQIFKWWNCEDLFNVD